MKKKFLFTPHKENENRYIDETTGDMWFKTKTRVLYADTDAAQVVYHANYLRYFEIGRAELIRDFGSSYKYIEEKNIYQPIIHVQMDFRYPADYDMVLDVYVRPTILETVKFTIEYKICVENTLKLTVDGKTIHCCINKEKKPCVVDDITKSLFYGYNAKIL